MKKKILICNFDMKGGGAEKVLLNLLKGLNPEKYDITLFLVFRVGVHLNSIPSHVKIKCVFRHQFSGFSTVMRLFSPKMLHRIFIHEHYDVEIAYLETSPTRIVSGAPKGVKKVCWVHIQEESINEFSSYYRSANEMVQCYNRFNQIVFVSKTAMKVFEANHPEITVPRSVIHNINDTAEISLKAQEPIDEPLGNCINICTIGRLVRQKSYQRLLQVVNRLNSMGLATRFHLYILGQGEEWDSLKQYIEENNLSNVTMLGFRTNPYKYLAKMDLFVCSSIKEGYSTAVTEATLLNIPVITTDVSGMDEILLDGEYGLIVPNDADALFEGMKSLIESPEKIAEYKQRLLEANKTSQAENLRRYEDLIDNL